MENKKNMDLGFKIGLLHLRVAWPLADYTTPLCQFPHLKIEGNPF